MTCCADVVVSKDIIYCNYDIVDYKDLSPFVAMPAFFYEMKSCSFSHILVHAGGSHS
jgi:hypothetical protein